MATGKFISYIRVSTQKQGASGLGLEAQRESIGRYLDGGKWELLAEFVEVESGKRDDRPQLQKALQRCQITGAVLIIAKLDRLSRDLHFITSLQKAGIEFIACDMPAANRFTIHIFAALAEYERELIGKRTREALAALKARGVTLGKPENLSKEAAHKGRTLGRTVKLNKANAFARQVAPDILEFRRQGLSLNATATRLNEANVLTARGKRGGWTPTAVKNVLAKVQTEATT